MNVRPLVAAIAVPAMIVSSQPAAMAGPISTQTYSPTSPMVFVTANVGRKYDGASISVINTHWVTLQFQAR